MKNMTDKVNSIDANIKDAESSLENFRKAVINYNQELIRLRKEKENMGDMINNTISAFEEKINEIATLPIVSRVNLTKEGIRIDYKGIINIKDDNGKTYPLGEFYLIIRPNGITLRNKTPFKYDGVVYHHPHINSSHACLGSWEDKVYDLLGNNKYKELVLLLYLYLKSYNSESPYVEIEDLWRQRGRR